MADYDEDDDETIASSALDDDEDEDDADGDGSNWESSEEEMEESALAGGQQQQEQKAHAGDGGGSVAAGTVEGMRISGEAPKRPSVYRGVCQMKHGRWQAQITTNGRKHFLSLFDDEEAAARAYDEKAKQVFDNPVLNFLPDGSLNPDRKFKRELAPKRPSTYRGVYWSNGRWRAEISTNGHQQYLGTYDTEEAAARAYDDTAKQLHNNSILNFLPDGSLNSDRKKTISGRSVVYQQQLDGTQSGDINQDEEDAVTLGVKGENGEQTEDEIGRGRPRKRGRWGHQEEEERKVTVGIKTEEGTVVKDEQDKEEEEGENADAGSA